MRTNLIIGASSGTGKRLALLLHENGEEVFGTFNKTTAALPVRLHHLDVLAKEHDLTFLPETVDTLVYCPGTITLKPFNRMNAEDFINDYRLQVAGAVKIIQAVLPRLKKSLNPSILLFSTVAVQTGFAFHTMVSSSKGAIEGLTRALAAELAPSIRVNCLAPGITDTPLAAGLLNSDEKRKVNAERHPLKRIGTTFDLAHAAAFLISPHAGWITGQIVHVDGGLSSLKP
jgi:NAD(P)-dependent dehydrogenase (short-subunit alcohol dehydrogenase family)